MMIGLSGEPTLSWKTTGTNAAQALEMELRITCNWWAERVVSIIAIPQVPLQDIYGELLDFVYLSQKFAR